MEYVTIDHCPLCGGSRSQVFDRREFRDYPVENCICMDCGLVFQSPRMSEEALAEFYAAEYRRTYQGDEDPNPKDIFVQERRAAHLVQFLKDHGAASLKPASCLDVGASTGLLLERLQQELQLTVVGVEPGDAYRAYAKRRGLQVVPSLVDARSVSASSFGLITLVHVLEHLPHPVETLRELREKFLSSDGYLLIETPNLYTHDCFEVAHLVSFSAHTLRETLRKSGFAVVAEHAHGVPRSRVLPLYLTVLAGPVASPDQTYAVQAEQHVQRKRKWGMLWRRIVERLMPRWAWLPLPKS
jgi:2-polyprenyl-3-methyl-5-hydroxy-6-metoxy-1,4-benzoquinol methylase